MSSIPSRISSASERPDATEARSSCDFKASGTYTVVFRMPPIMPYVDRAVCRSISSMPAQKRGALRHQHKAVQMPRLDRPEVPMVERGDRVDAVALGQRDDGGGDDAEG